MSDAAKAIEARSGETGTGSTVGESAGASALRPQVIGPMTTPPQPERNESMSWQPIESAPKGSPAPYGSGPEVLGVCSNPAWTAYSIVRWFYHKNPARGAWKGPHGVWEPTHWMPLPSPPTTEGDGA